jgi:hypothetical protein
MFWELLMDFLFLGLIDGIMSLFGSKSQYKFIVSDFKNGTKFRIRSVHLEKKQKYKIQIEQLSSGKFQTLEKGIFDNENVIEEFQNKKTQSGFIFSEHHFDKLKMGNIKFTLDSIDWYKTNPRK